MHVPVTCGSARFVVLIARAFPARQADQAMWAFSGLAHGADALPSHRNAWPGGGTPSLRHAEAPPSQQIIAKHSVRTIPSGPREIMRQFTLEFGEVARDHTVTSKRALARGALSISK